MSMVSEWGNSPRRLHQWTAWWVFYGQPRFEALHQRDRQDWLRCSDPQVRTIAAIWTRGMVPYQPFLDEYHRLLKIRDALPAK